MPAYTPLTGAACGCKRGIERDNCPNCEGTGKAIDFHAIHAQREREQMKSSSEGHLKRWMEDATSNIGMAHGDQLMSSSEQSDYQAAAELAALESALREALDIVTNRPRKEVDAITWQIWADKARSALKAL